MDTCTDLRGVRRGGCSDPTCPCDGYDGGPERKRCIKCGHPPGKHRNLDNPSASMGTSTGTMPNSSHTGYHTAPPDLPLCTADGCTNKVWYEFDLREAFDYCSPECRDRHLLPIKKLELKEELVAMKQTLEREARKDSPRMKQQQQSNGQSSQPQQRLPGQGSSSPGNSPTTSSPLTCAKAQGGKRVIKKVTIEKKARKPSGLILCKKPYITDKAEVVGFIIVGVVKDTPAYSKLQDDMIRLLDIIEVVNDTPCHGILLPDLDLQARFEHSIDECESIRLELNCCIALPPVSKPLSLAKKKSPKFTHVVVLSLMYSEDYYSDTYGLTLDHKCKVKGTITNSPSELNRVKFGDKIIMYMVVSQDDPHDEFQLMSDKQLSSMKRDLQAAYQRKDSIILFLKKPEELSYI